MQDLQLKITLNPAIDVAKLNVVLRALKDALGPNFGKDIRLIDSAKLKSELKSVSDEVKTINEEFKKVSETVKRTTQQGEGMGKAFKFNQVIEGTQHAAHGFETVMSESVLLDKQLRNIGTLGVDNWEEFGAVAKRISAEVPDDTAKIADGIYQAISAGIDPSKAEGFVRVASKAAVAGISDTFTAVDVLTTSVNAFRSQGLTAERAADVMFQTVVRGKTTFPQLSSSMSIAASFAATMGVSFESLNGAVATLTKNGVPTAEAFTQISAAMTALTKGSTPEMERVFTKLGVTTGKELIAKFGSLQAAMIAVRDAGDGDEGFLVKAFGRVEGFKAMLQLTGENAQTAKDDLDSVTNSAGRANAAYDIAAGGIEVRTTMLVKTITSSVRSVLGVVGEAGEIALGGIAKTAPTLTALAATKSIIPESAIQATENSIKKLLPQVQRMAPSLFEMGANGTSAFVGMGKAAITFAANPAVIAIGALVALGAATALLSDQLHETAAERQEEAKAQLEMIQAQKSEEEAKRSEAQSTSNLAKEYILLSNQVQTLGENSKEAAAKKERLAQITDSLNEKYPGVIKRTGDFATNLTAVEDLAKKSAGSVESLSKSIGELTDKEKSATEFIIKNNVNVVKEEMEDAFVEASNKGATGMVGKLSETLTGSSTARRNAEEYTEQWSKGIYNAKNVDELKDATDAWLKDAQTKVEKGEWTAQQYNLARKFIQNLSDAQRGWIDQIQKDANAAAQKIAQTDVPKPKQNFDQLVAKLEEDKAKLAKDVTAIIAEGKSDVQLRRERLVVQGKEEEIQKRIDFLQGKKETSGKSEFERVKKTYEIEKKNVESAEKQDELTRETMIMAERREKNAFDELIDENAKLDSLQQQAEKMAELFRIGADGKIGIHFKNADEKTEAETMVTEMANAITAQQNKVGSASLKVDLDEQKLKEDLRKFELEKLQFQIELGIVKQDAMLAEVDKDLAVVRVRMATANETERRVLEQKEFELQRQIFSIRKAISDEEIKLIDERQKLEQDALQRTLEQAKRMDDALRTLAEKSGTSAIERQTNAELKMLETKKKRSLDLVGNNEEQKAAVEERYAILSEDIKKRSEDRKAVIQARSRGSEMEGQRQRDLISLSKQQADLQEKLSRAQSDPTQKDQAKELRKQLDEVQRVLNEKKDPLIAVADEIALGMQEGLGAMFDGDTDAMKDSFRNMMGVIAGMLEKLASAAIAKMVMDWLLIDPMAAALPWFVKLVTIPVINAAASGLVHAIAGPVIGGLTSFSTGGRVDGPTVALIGDASASIPGRNTEWVTRDADLMTFARMVAIEVKGQDSVLLIEIREELRAIRSKDYALRGTDLVLAEGRTTAAQARRART